MSTLDQTEQHIEPMADGSPLLDENDLSSSLASEKPHVIAFVNYRSGSGKGGEVFKMLEKTIGEENIYDILSAEMGPKAVIEEVHRTHPQFRIIVCGGDGSVNWVLSLIADLGYDDISIGIIPNGTGNDTSRYLGWGQCQFNPQTTQANINKMVQKNTPTHEFDRWQLFFSFRKDEMVQWTQRLEQTGEVPPNYLYGIKSNICNNNTGTVKSGNNNSAVAPVSASGNENSKNSKNNNSSENQIEFFEYKFPKYFKSITRLDELQYLERYKYLHDQQQPQSYIDLPLINKRTQTMRLSTFLNGVDQPDQNSDDIGTKKAYAQYLESRSKWFRFTWSFNNYFSLGIDAQVMNYFGIHRDSHPGCYFCRCCTLTWIGTCSTVTCVRCQKRPLRYRIDILYRDEDLTPVGAIDSLNTIHHPNEPLPQLEDKNRNNKHQQIQTDAKKGINNSDQTNDEGIDLVISTTGPTIDESTPHSMEWLKNNDSEYSVPEDATFIDNPSHLVDGYKWLSATFDPMQYGALVLLNIPSYAGGRNIWGTKSQMDDRKSPWLVEEHPQDTKDGRLELVSFTGFQQMQFTVMTQGASYRLGQLQGLRIYMQNDGYVQLDGEAWIQPPGIIEIYRSKPGKMLFNDSPDYPCC